MVPHWHADPATGPQLTYLESLHQKLRGEIRPAFNGLTKGEASAMIEEAKGLLLRRDHETLMDEAPQGGSLPCGPQYVEGPANSSKVVSLGTPKADAWQAAEERRRVRLARAEAFNELMRERFVDQFGIVRRRQPSPPQNPGLQNPLVVWLAAPIRMDLNGHIRTDWKWICYHELHGTDGYKVCRGGSQLGWRQTYNNAMTHYQKYHCDPRQGNG